MALDAGGISAIVFSALFAIVTVLLIVQNSGKGGDVSGLLDFATKLVSFSPYCLLVFGWIADATSGQYVYTKSGITALIGLAVNAIVGAVIKAKPSSSTPQAGGAWWKWVGDISSVSEDSPKCALPGLGDLENPYAPQGVLMSTTILFYLLTGLWDAGEGMQSIALSVITAVTFIVQWITLSANGCLREGYFGKLAPLTSFVIGIIVAVSSYFIQKAIDPSSVSGGGGGGGGGSILGPGGTKQLYGPGGEQIIVVGDKGKQTAPVNDQDQFVCEAYKDGELVTSTIAD